MKSQKHHFITSLVCLLLLASLLSSCSMMNSLFHTHTFQDSFNEEKHWKECVECGEKVDETLHQLTQKEHVDVTCEQVGYTVYQCAECGFARTDTQPARFHQFKNAPDSNARVCSVCGKEEPMLSELPESGRYGYLYLAALANGKVLTRTYEKISAAIQEYKSSVTIGETLTKEELATVFHCTVIDHPEYFWLDPRYEYSYNQSGLIKEMQLNYYVSTSDLESAKTAFLDAADEILSGISVSMSDLEKEIYLHDTVVKRAVYDKTYSAPMNHSAYGNLIYGTSVCDGYTKLLQYLLGRCGILTTTVSGYSGENHSWNIVRLDGEWYMVDPTWDDPIGQEAGKTSHTYFNCTWDAFAQDHSFFEPTGEPIENYFTVPTCNTDRYNYFHYYNYEGSLNLETIERVARAQAALGQKNDFELCLTGHGSTPTEKAATIRAYLDNEANRNHVFSIFAKILGRPAHSITLSYSISKDGNILKLSIN